ncbi:ras-related protein Rab-23 isoform X1 [Cavia porcellus]|uniref:ras-related protein Rab-23 isoform X1 n=1 Tax=Cavia porcellus TaxID=10141 RepID=UPI000661B0BF|nr:ras-related protein Rab-23 isoform X1 [Cavia porcellus]XP_012999260.1 ras-related protein Rab-23 isoform X1 [Cavia porcellus]XP_012999261.1 ras-related protein Rab-23 isoform X1 [Cavia porcellus]XP_012999262.1 ras-related protein Rab-23 isoform X1 [Cavia porcellus]
MLEEDMEVAIKMVVVGNGAVGKSSMIQRYCKGVFTKDYKKTIGVDFLERQIQINDEDVRLMLWDTAGQEEFDAITKAYYRGAQACVLVFSTIDRESFEAVSSWREKVVAEVGEIPTVLVQNKIDLLDDSCIKNEEAEALAKRLKLRFYRTSVKEDLNVNEDSGPYACQAGAAPLSCVPASKDLSANVYAFFKYLAEKYLQKLKQQTVENPELKHSSSNKIGVFSTSGGSRLSQSSTINGGDVINLRPNKERTKKSRNPFSSCSVP